MYTTNSRKFKGEIENYLAGEKKRVIGESIPNKALHPILERPCLSGMQELFVKIQKGAEG